jgi:hypothetical protein
MEPVKYRLILLHLCATLFVCLPSLEAQNVVFNGDFETGQYDAPWTLFGGNTYSKIAMFEVQPGIESLCLKRRPGEPDNGGLAQEVHLIEGTLYHFTAKLAAQFCAT